MGVAVAALSDREPGTELLVAAHRPRVGFPGAAGAQLGPAQYGLAGRQIDTEPAVSAAEEPVAVHRFTLCGAP